MKKRAVWAGAALGAVLLAGAALFFRRPPAPLTQGPVELMVATDLHYLTPAYREEGSEQLRMSLSFGDGKQIFYQEELTDAFFEEVIRQQPTALVLLGDLSYNGEEASHIALAQKLQQVRKAGVAVYLVPGNHDINIYNARAFYKEGTQPVPSVSPQRFDEIYAGCNEAAVLSRDETTRSFAVALSPQLRLLMLDGALYEQNAKGNMPAGGELGEETLAWAEECLASAQKNGAEVIAAGHFGVLPHNPFLKSGYQYSNAGQLQRLLEKYGVPLYLSGHIHTQSIVQEGALTDAATSALCVNPCQWARVGFEPGRALTYDVHRVEVEEWARRQGRSEPDLLDFAAYNEAYFTRVAYYKLYPELIAGGLSKEESHRIASLQARLNTAYFAGQAHELAADILAGADYALYMEKGPMPEYLNSMLQGPGENTHWEQDLSR